MWILKMESGPHGIRRYVTEFWDVGRGGWEDDLKQAADMMRGILDRQLVTER